MMDPNVESRICERLSALHAHLHGKGSSAARTYIASDDVVVVVLEETFTPAEQALVDRGEAEGIQELRRRSTPTPSSTTPRSTSSRATALARDTRLRLWAAHLERDIAEVAGDPSTVIDELWRPIAAEQRERRNRGEPLTHKLVELHATSRRSERLLGPLQALLVDG